MEIRGEKMGKSKISKTSEKAGTEPVLRESQCVLRRCWTGGEAEEACWSSLGPISTATATELRIDTKKWQRRVIEYYTIEKARKR